MARVEGISRVRMHNGAAMMKPVRGVALFLLYAVALPSLLPARQKKHSIGEHSVAEEGNYVAALATANRFLYAWQTQDEEEGLELLTDAAKEHASEEQMESYFSGDAGSERTYEISHGRKLRAGRYSFPVALFEMAAGGDAEKRVRPRLSHILVVQVGEGEWLVDKAP
jgi:hypothetical protein